MRPYGPLPAHALHRASAIWMGIALVHAALLWLWAEQRRPRPVHTEVAAPALTYIVLPRAVDSGPAPRGDAPKQPARHAPPVLRVEVPTRSAEVPGVAGLPSMADALPAPGTAAAQAADEPASAVPHPRLNLTLPAGAAQAPTANPAVHDARSNTAPLTAWERFDRSVRENEAPICLELANSRSEQLNPYNIAVPLLKRCKKAR